MTPLTLGKYSVGVGDRFAHQAAAQLTACGEAAKHGLAITPVWNKSNREHSIIGSEPASVRIAAMQAVRDLNWSGAFHIDADHITPATVSRFLADCDFFTLDVAETIGKAAPDAAIDDFCKRHQNLVGTIQLDEIAESLTLDSATLRTIATKYLAALLEAGSLYRTIEARKGAGNFIVELSMDETDEAQTPLEVLVILAAIADEQIPVQTFAPKFSGRFNKGVDYVGSVAGFEAEFRADLAAIHYAVTRFNLPQNLKLSIHSGSDKFSIYPAMHRAITDFDTGLHLKTAGTTWLEELIGLAEADSSALALAKEIYAAAYEQRESLAIPYATVIHIDPAKLPTPSQLARWSADEFTSALRHNLAAPQYNPHLRQLLHIAFKVAAQMGPRYLDQLVEHRCIIARNVATNLLDRHIMPVFAGPQQ